MRDLTVGEHLDRFAAALAPIERTADLEAIRVRLADDPPRKWPTRGY